MSNYDLYSIEEICKYIKQIKENEPVIQKKNLYFAGPWFSGKAHTTYCKLQTFIKNFKNSKYNVFFPKDTNLTDSPKPEEIFKKDIEELDKCDTVLAWVDEKDMGTAFEIGYAVAKKKNVILLGFDRTTFYDPGHKTNLMLASSCTGWIEFQDLPSFLAGNLRTVNNLNNVEVE